MTLEALKRAEYIVKLLSDIESDIKLFSDSRSYVNGFVIGDLYGLPNREQQTTHNKFIPKDYIKAILLKALENERDLLTKELEAL